MSDRMRLAGEHANGMVLEETVAELERLLAEATPGPWSWWTSCSFRRLSSDATGKDGDVLHGSVQSDGLADITGSDADKALIVAAVNALPSLLAALKRRSEDAETAHGDVKLLERHLQDTRNNYVRDWTELSTENARLRADADVGELLRKLVESGGSWAVESPSAMTGKFCVSRNGVVVFNRSLVAALRQLLGGSNE